MFNEVGILHFLLGFVLGHVCGSVPSGLWLVQAFHGIDIRNYGSKNIGTTNVFRIVGPKTAVLVLIADAFKGILAVGIMSYFFHNPLLDVVTALGALLGHNYSLFLGFKGGKGVATALGLLIFMMPKVAVASFGIWLVCVLLTRYVSLGSIMAAIFTPPLAWYLGYPSAYVIFSVVAAFFVVLRHKENIHRLLTGTESKIKPGNAKDLQK
ncbi:glycerol-3-phosphate 1-O-acyltransferase PlsY [Phascolarctobacterium succinatutens]|jgi:glycerol-3-phosphate acyltransferase PlsY|uniref:glycerol-3-phosphate 1-O-acyltransferase PlsY n=2 Tax=Phascolarctobacterium succinatutens TaxID=626940 RepID=UPI001B708848|nr:glycerol-3-phosphate 1-O-acyltransferase PlsY [Phascolarctobacterium succinatutens]MBP7224599.1 glycerol-3-phosphate 1-O-acyltransferase PlsY [Phascolarctobacterium sp.]MDD7141168.1 glycerol-3-phosphate 1-O-acyltransferase PlsY [Phascolarctobacterium succinatutens]MDY3839851.1 glycerol-3-phosphate 1-O-acyltransferase PlsY [Phascolarctobacterium succinatutens]MEE0356105.1 glycerol-3-phosphate 1-O-acyltransferase PlsY [Phascolarctobacterium succinatutens]